MRVPKSKLVVALGILLVGFSYLVYGAVREASTYSVPVRDIPRFLDSKPEVKVIGKVKQGSIAKQPSGLGAFFVLTDETGEIPVAYRGAVPDMLREGGQVIVQGTLANGTFQAKTLLTSCPSRYSAESEANPSQNKTR